MKKRGPLKFSFGYPRKNLTTIFSHLALEELAPLYFILSWLPTTRLAHHIS
jgi:hypothetical protein